MELRQLRYLEAVIRHRHFTRAADELHVAQSALSHQIRRLERELGIELVRRTTRMVEPTEAGELVAARARSILSETAALQHEVEGLRGLVTGHVTVGAMLFGGELDIPAILARFTAAFPDVEIGLREGTAQRMLEMLGDGSLDVAFALEARPREELARLPLSTEELALAISVDHPLAPPKPRRSSAGARPQPVPLRQLQGERLIAFQRGSSTRELVYGALRRAGVQPRIALEANDFALVRSLVARGIGLAILPRSFLERPGPPIAIRSLSPELRMSVALWWRRDRWLSPAAQAFVEFTAAQRQAVGD